MKSILKVSITTTLLVMSAFVALSIASPFVATASTGTSVSAAAATTVPTSTSASASTGSLAKYTSIPGGITLGSHPSIGTAAAAAASSRIKTIPTWSSYFVGNDGNAYQYRMVGTKPTFGGTTWIQNDVFPIDLTLKNKSGTWTFSGSQYTQKLENSPLYQNAMYKTGDKTQFENAMYRAEFQKVEKSNWNTLLASPSVWPTSSFMVPAKHGIATVVQLPHSKVWIANLNVTWFIYNVLFPIANAYLGHVSPTHFVIFQTFNTVLSNEGTLNGCCIIGFHSYFNGPKANGPDLWTFGWASYITGKDFVNSKGQFVPIDDINPLSHEIAETFNDPLVDNLVQFWSVPSEPQYGCSNILEVGDPLVGTAIPTHTGGMTYHPQDLAFYSWFSRDSSVWKQGDLGWKGWFDYLGIFKTYSSSAGCP